MAPGDPRRWAVSKHALLRDSRRTDFHPSGPWTASGSPGEATDRRKFNAMGRERPDVARVESQAVCPCLVCLLHFLQTSLK